MLQGRPCSSRLSAWCFPFSARCSANSTKERPSVFFEFQVSSSASSPARKSRASFVRTAGRNAPLTVRGWGGCVVKFLPSCRFRREQVSCSFLVSVLYEAIGAPNRNQSRSIGGAPDIRESAQLCEEQEKSETFLRAPAALAIPSSFGGGGMDSLSPSN